MIEIAKLRHMLHAETAASKWWNSLSPEEQKSYLAAHPESKFAAGAKPHTDSRIKALHAHHDKKADYHWAQADNGGPNAAAHNKAGNIHQTIANHYTDAIDAKNRGASPRNIEKHLNRAERTKYRLDQHKAATGIK